MRLDDAVTYFLGQWPVEGATPATVRTYKTQLKWLVGFAASRRKVLLSDLTPEFLRAAMAAKLAPPNATAAFKGGEASANSLAFAARAMAGWLLAQGVPVPDLTVVKPPRPPERVQPRLHQNEFAALESAILRRLVSSRQRVPRASVARDLALIYLLADTGLRASEVCAMDVRSVDFEHGSILVVRGKGKKERALSILDPNDQQGGVTLRLLADWIDARQTIRLTARHNKLWTSMKGRPLSADELRRVLGRICLAAGIAANRPPHAFRRASFTEAYLAQPTAIRVIAARMGWSSKSHSMIDIYTRGAEVDLAADTPMPSLSSRWRNSPDGPSNVRSFRSIPNSGVGPPRGGMRNGPAADPLARNTADRAADQNSRRSRRRSV